MANTGRAVLIVPAIVVAEVYYLSVKTGQPLPPADLLGVIDTSASLASSDLGRRQLEMLDRLTEIPEMHDRLIAASPQVQSIW